MLKILVTCAATMLFLASHTGLVDRPKPQVSRPDENSRSFTQTKDQSNNPPEPFILLHSVTVDSGEGSNDEARGIAIGNDGNIYVTGYVTRAGNGRDIWLAKYDKTLGYLDSVIVNGTANGDDEGYTMAFDGDGYLYLVGYMTEAGENNNIWLGKFNSANIFLGIFDTNLVLQDSIILNGIINDTDKARFMVFDDSRHLFVSGSVTQAVTDYDIWIGKFQEDLTFVDEVIVAGPTTDEDKGYGIVFDGSDTLFVTGTMIEPGESYNIWMAAYDTDLNLLDSLTINGPVNGEDVAYLMTMDDRGRLFHTGVYTEVDGGSNVWVARFNTELDLEAWTTLDGPAGGYDTGVGLVTGPDHDLYVSAVVSDPLEGFNIWIGHYDVSMFFADGFESGDTSGWSSMVP